MNMPAPADVGWLLAWAPLIVVVLLTWGYLAAAYAQRSTAAGWSGWRCGFFIIGSLLLAIALMPPMMDWAHHDLRGHMAAHLLIGMVAPLAWVLAAPVSLLLRSLPQAGGRRLVDVLHSRPLQVVTHPVSALFLNIGGMYALYLTPLYAASLHSPLLHYWLHVHFLLAGYLFCWAILAGPDVSPHRLSLRFRLVVLFISIAAHSLLGKLMYGYGWPRGTAHGQENIQAAAQWMYYGGDLAEMLLAMVLLSVWLRQSPRHRERLLASDSLRSRQHIQKLKP
ncbi:MULTISPECIES: cytochrome c oxidase assembly protein [unclassified Halomonas]|uniref:cytochrome c oxidase assembly protein n=1 Tax=unclassified Halomonas TaxID=2609666 RepID=UPI0006D9D17D|nr:MULTISPECIES: cytochrome c oxidase assembly protein [unclassified Halomonas]KPQ22628.1 MAG: putative membrane protein [Halomonas sp. HL-93]SBR45489.1 putative membrane protein [Halomonas sp. HL-93]SNY98304.1 putative membrane protein [Halomonas sp. hl-4]